MLIIKTPKQTNTINRLQFHIKGLVQGVGFRPHVYKAAAALALTGWVCNDSEGVLIEVQGCNTNSFQAFLIKDLPVLARIDAIRVSEVPIKNNENQFNILASKRGKVTAKIAPDSGVCDACLVELFDPASRFYHYPFINCTYCGPRFTITRQLPYDRHETSMAEFTMCLDCAAEYYAPLNRRFHAQPIACDHCGPQLSHSLDELVAYIRTGKILAIKGLGGYQLICDAYNENTVSELRRRKKRTAKPFAVMVADKASANLIASCSAQELNLLSQSTRSIVLVNKQADDPLASGVAPGLSILGIMLPYTPLHYLLFDQLNKESAAAFIVTSANISGEPLITDDEIAKQALSAIADVIVTHNRPIVMRTDDSVMRIINKAPIFIRRARSFVPLAIPLAHELPATLALGAYLKNTICVTRGKEAFISQHIGDLDDVATIEFYHETIKHFLKILDVKIECVAHDLHPDFYSSQIAPAFNKPILAVQHHHAHIAAVAAEYHLTKPVLGLALDGFGLGTDGGAWGGEVLLYHDNQFERLGSLLPIAQPCGDKAVQQPWRMAASVLFQLNHAEQITKQFSQFSEASFIMNMLKNKINTSTTSSCGRLFDAASALLNVCQVADYEGQAAMLLESLVTKPQVFNKGWLIDNNQLNLLPTLKYLLTCDPVEGANIFHGTLAAALADWIIRFAEPLNIDTVLLGGGCFLNKPLTECLIKALAAQNIKALLPQQAPVNDGGISLGQAWVAGNYFRN